jgi:ribonuclease VapC
LLEAAALAQAALFISIINLGEVFYCVGKVKGEDAARATLAELQRLNMTVVPASDELVMAAAQLKIRHAISYADAFAAAAALAHDAVLMTGDPELEALAGELRLERLQRRPR